MGCPGHQLYSDAERPRFEGRKGIATVESLPQESYRYNTIQRYHKQTGPSDVLIQVCLPVVGESTIWVLLLSHTVGIQVQASQKMHGTE